MLLTELIDIAYLNGRIGRCDPNITPRNFPDEDIRNGLELISRTELGLDAHDWYLTSQIREAMDSRGWSPATMIELADYASRGWDLVTPVAAIGYPWICEEFQEAARIHLDYIPTEFVGTLQLVPRRKVRTLSLASAETKPWNDKFRFLAFRTAQTPRSES